MNVFILNAGRCGSTTFIKACQHISNYTAAHESLTTCIGDQRLLYPENHIEADNRLSWMLGRLDRAYADNAMYVHLRRDRSSTAESFARRSGFGIMQAYKDGILMEGQQGQSAYDVALDYIDTVEANISLFLKDKTRTMDFSLENAQNDFRTFWDFIGAEGKLEDALGKWDTSYNASMQV